MPNKPDHISDALWSWSKPFAENPPNVAADIRDRMRAVPPPSGYSRAEVREALAARVPARLHGRLNAATLGLVTAPPADAVQWAKGLPDGGFPLSQRQMEDFLVAHPPPAFLSRDEILSGLLQTGGNNIDIPPDAFMRAVSVARSREPVSPTSPSGRPLGIDKEAWKWSEPLQGPPPATRGSVRDHIENTPPPNLQRSHIRNAVKARAPQLDEVDINSALIGLERPARGGSFRRATLEWVDRIPQSGPIHGRETVAGLLREYPPPAGVSRREAHAALTDLRGLDMPPKTFMRAYIDAWGPSAVERPRGHTIPGMGIARTAPAPSSVQPSAIAGKRPRWHAPPPAAAMQSAMPSGAPQPPTIASTGHPIPSMGMDWAPPVLSNPPSTRAVERPQWHAPRPAAARRDAMASEAPTVAHTPHAEIFLGQSEDHLLDTIIPDIDAAPFLGQSEDHLLDAMIPDIRNTRDTSCTGPAPGAFNSTPVTQPPAPRGRDDDQGWER